MRQNISIFRHSLQISLLIADMIAFGMFFSESGFYATAISLKSVLLANVTFIGTAILCMYVLYKQDFYASYVCLKPKAFYQQTTTTLILLNFIVLLLMLIIQYPIQSFSTLQSMLAINGYMLISRLLVFSIAKPKTTMLLFTHDSDTDIRPLLSEQSPYLIGVIDPSYNPYAQHTSALLIFEKYHHNVLTRFRVDEIWIDQHAAADIRPETLEYLLDRSIALKVVDVPHGSLRYLQSCELLGIKQSYTNKQLAALTSHQPKIKAELCVLDDIALEVDYFCKRHIEAVEQGAECKIFILDVMPISHELPKLQSFIKSIIHTLKQSQLDLFTGQVKIISCYGLRDERELQLTAWLERIIVAYCQSFKDIEVTAIRLGELLSRLDDKMAKVRQTHIAHNHVALSSPHAEIGFHSHEALDAALVAGFSVKSGNYFVDIDQHISCMKLLDRVILSEGKYPRIHDGKTHRPSEIKIIFDPSSPLIFEDQPKYFGRDITGSHTKGLLHFESVRLDRKKASYLVQSAYQCCANSDVDGFWGIVSEFKVKSGYEDGRDGAVASNGYEGDDGNDNMQGASSNVQNVEFTDVFK